MSGLTCMARIAQFGIQIALTCRLYHGFGEKSNFHSQAESFFTIEDLFCGLKNLFYGLKNLFYGDLFPGAYRGKRSFVNITKTHPPIWGFICAIFHIDFQTFLWQYIAMKGIQNGAPFWTIAKLNRWFVPPWLRVVSVVRVCVGQVRKVAGQFHR